MTTIDLGNGRTAQRHHLDAGLLHIFDETSKHLDWVRGKLRDWIKPLYPMQAPAGFSGDVICNIASQSGRTYSLGEVGGAVLIDQRDVPTFANFGFTDVPSQQPTAGLRVGLVFLDAATGDYLRYDGNAWAAVTLE